MSSEGKVKAVTFSDNVQILTRCRINKITKTLYALGSIPLCDLHFLHLYQIDIAKNIKDYEKITKYEHSCVEKSAIINIHPAVIRFRNRRKKEKGNKLETDLSHGKTKWHIPMKSKLFLSDFKMQDYTKNFQIIGLIAKGGFGKVYKVFEINDKRTYAMKIIHKNKLTVEQFHYNLSKIFSENGISQLKDEVKIQKACGHHTFIVNCCYTFQSSCELSIVTDYHENGDFYSFQEKFILTEEISKLYIAEIAIAVDFLHNIGVIYRDLKPENILLDRSYHIRLTDFGLAKWLPRGTKTSTLCGTDLFLAPEIRVGYYSHAVDWWSLGIMACHMITDEYPIFSERRIILPESLDVNIPAKDLLYRLLHYDPTQRLRTLHMLKSISFYKDIDFKDVLNKKSDPVKLLHECIRRSCNDENKCNDFFKKI